MADFPYKASRDKRLRYLPLGTHNMRILGSPTTTYHNLARLAFKSYRLRTYFGTVLSYMWRFLLLLVPLTLNLLNSLVRMVVGTVPFFRQALSAPGFCSGTIDPRRSLDRPMSRHIVPLQAHPRTSLATAGGLTPPTTLPKSKSSRLSEY